MHIILALLGTIVTILILLNRLNESGIDLGWLNPFSWARRRKFRNEHDLNPVFKLDSPMEAAAILMLASAKIDGDITREQKALSWHLTSTFQKAVQFRIWSIFTPLVFN